MVLHMTGATSISSSAIRNPQKLAAEFSDLGRLRTAFEESNLPMLLDVFDWARLPPEFRAEIERQHVVVQAGMSK